MSGDTFNAALRERAGRGRVTLRPAQSAGYQQVDDMIRQAAGRLPTGDATAPASVGSDDGPDDAFAARARKLGCVDIAGARLLMGDGHESLRGAALHSALERLARRLPDLFPDFDRMAAAIAPGLDGGARGLGELREPPSLNATIRGQMAARRAHVDSFIDAYDD